VPQYNLSRINLGMYEDKETGVALDGLGQKLKWEFQENRRASSLV
jgi:hypothetical protein